MHIAVLPILLCFWTLCRAIEFPRAENTSKSRNETNIPLRRQPFGARGVFGKGFFLPRPGAGSNFGAGINNGSDTIVIENTDKNDSSSQPFLTRNFPVIPPRVCPKQRSCFGRCSSTRQSQNITEKNHSFRCFCDPECNNVFQDCCADYERYCKGNESQKDAEAAVSKGWTCGKVKGKGFGIWMIATCALGWPDDELRSKCENAVGEITLPNMFTIVTDAFNNIFRNRYCAECNRVDNFTWWTLEAENATKTSKVSWKLYKNEGLPQISPNASSQLGIRYCFKTQTSCKYMDNATEVLKCRDGLTGLVSYKKKTYRNVYCLKCNHRYSFGIFPPRVWCGPVLSLEGRIDFSAIFGKGQPKIPKNTGIANNRCSPGFLYDQIARSCRKLSSTSGTKFTFLTKYAVQLSYTRSENLECYNYRKSPSRKVFLVRFREAFERRITLNLPKTKWKFSNLAISANNENYISVTFQILAIKSEIKEADLSSLATILKIHQVNYLYDLRNVSSVCSYELATKIPREMKCVNQNHSNVAIKMENVSISDNGTLLLASTRENFKQGEYLLYNDQNRTRLAKCKKSLPANCKYFLKEKSHWKMFPNQSIYTGVANMWFDYGEYSVIDGVVWLCLTQEVSMEKENLRTVHETILRYSSLFCLSISISSLVVLLSVYSIAPSLRTLPGKIIMLLSSVLALAHLLWLLQDEASNFHHLCIALALLLHYLFLASFTCSTSFAVLSFLTFQGIANGKLGQSNEGKAAFLGYTALALGFPFVWVMVFGLLDFNGVFLLGYGNSQGLCWLGNINGLHVSFTVPVFVLLSLNLALLLATINMIQKCSKTSQNLSEATKGSLNKREVCIYIRISTLMGSTWLFGVFQLVFPSVVVFQYLFVFANGLQGLYIATAFLCTDNVKKILCKTVGSISTKTSRISSSK